MAMGVAGLRVTVAGRSYALVPGVPVRVGRDPECDIAVNDLRVSRHHVIIEEAGTGWRIRDLGSRNGIFVDGQRVDSVEVNDGLEVRLGGVDGEPLMVARDEKAVVARPGSPAAIPHPPSAPAPPEPVRPPGVIRIGRAPDNTVVLDDLLVSRHHAELRMGQPAELVDLSSANGTFVNGRKVERALVGPDDTIGIGQRSFRVTQSGLEAAPVRQEVRFAATGLRVRTSKGTVILDGIDLAVGDRGFLAVVGPSGTGKSTLLNALTGVRPADAGTVLYEGRDLYAEYDDLRSRLGVVPQDDVVHPLLTVRQALQYAAELRFPREVSKAEREARVEEVMEELHLSFRADVPVKVLSGGQRKRVSVALELLTKPPLLFLDEPTSGLDPGLERDLMELFRRLADEGRTVIVVTHSVASLHLCDRVLVVAPGGREAFFGPPDEVTQYFGQPDWEGVFQRLGAEPDTDWPARYASSSQRRQYLPELDRPEVLANRSSSLSPSRGRSGFQQFRTLTRRFLSVMKADRLSMLLLIAQPIVLGVLQLLVLPRHQLAPPTSGSLRIYSSAATVLFNPVQVATALGLTNAVTQLVRERSIFRRERTYGLSIPAYLGSKAVVLAVIAVVQAAIVVGVALIDEGGPTSALALGKPFIELTAVIGLTGIAASTLGLLVSALASTETVAMTVLPMVLVVESVLTFGALIPNSLDKPVLNQAQYISSTQWGFSAAAATSDLNQLNGLSSVFTQLSTVNTTTLQKFLNGKIKTEGQRRYRHLRSVWFQDMGALLALAIVALVATGLALARGDPTLTR